MVTSYILILALSAALLAFGAGWAQARLAHALKRPVLPAGAITLAVAAAMLVVVAAPWWLFMLLGLLALALWRMGERLPFSPALALLALTLPLMAAPLLGATAGLAIDAALIAAALMGETYAT